MSPPCICTYNRKRARAVRTQFVTEDASMAEPGVAEGVLVRAVFITNYRPRTGFMTPQKREERGAGVPSMCFAGSPFNPPQMFIFRPIIANFH